MNVERIRNDFDLIASLDDNSSSSRYDAFLLDVVPHDAARVLEIGCGLGRLTSKLLREGRDIVALDLSPGMIARARARTPDRVEWICDDFLTHDFGNREFDCIITAATLHHMPADAALQKMRALLRRGGRLVVHDLRTTSGVMDMLGAWLVLAREAVVRLVKTGRPVPARAVRAAWDRHGRTETYLTFAQAAGLAAHWLPGARVYSHRGWRYTIIWDKPLRGDGRV
jgi:SAM-dependent methyltransferase